MTEPVKSADSILFGRFEFSADTGELREDVRLKLSVQAIQVLAMLAANPGKLVPREDYGRSCRPSGYGDPEHGNNAAVNKLREALSKSTTNHIHRDGSGRGDRFIATPESAAVTPEPQPPEPPPDLQPPKSRWWKSNATIAVAACVTTGALIYPLVAPLIKRQVRMNAAQTNDGGASHRFARIGVVTNVLAGWQPVAFAWNGGNSNTLASTFT